MNSNELAELKTHHGRRIKKVWWVNNNGDSACESSSITKLVLSSEYYGDRTENWIVAIDANGNEIERHNASQVATITWLKDGEW